MHCYHNCMIADWIRCYYTLWIIVTIQPGCSSFPNENVCRLWSRSPASGKEWPPHKGEGLFNKTTISSSKLWMASDSLTPALYSKYPLKTAASSQEKCLTLSTVICSATRQQSDKFLNHQLNVNNSAESSIRSHNTSRPHRNRDRRIRWSKSIFTSHHLLRTILSRRVASYQSWRRRSLNSTAKSRTKKYMLPMYQSTLLQLTILKQYSSPASSNSSSTGSHHSMSSRKDCKNRKRSFR